MVRLPLARAQRHDPGCGPRASDHFTRNGGKLVTSLEPGNQRAADDWPDVPEVSPVFRGIAWAFLFCAPVWAWIVFLIGVIK